MANIWELALLVLRTLPLMFTDMTYLLILGVVFVFVYRQYQKVHLYEKRLFGLINPLIDTATAYMGSSGLFATTLFVTRCPSSNGVATCGSCLLLMFIHPPSCASPMQGLVGLSSLIFGFPKVSIPSSWLWW